MTVDETVRTIEQEMSRLHRGMEAVRRPAATARFPAMDRAAYVLLGLLDGGPQRIGVLAERLHLDQSTVVRQVTALETKGLVERAADPDDGRAALVELTHDGRAQLAEARAGRAERVAALLDGWTTKERTDLARLLTKLNASMDTRLRTQR
jgi:DNA-binding MarR family transcriptional regulator